MTATFDNVTKIVEAASNGPVGVWVIDKKVKIVPTTQKKRFDSMINDYFQEFRGCFTKDCPVKVLKENLA